MFKKYIWLAVMVYLVSSELTLPNMEEFSQLQSCIEKIEETYFVPPKLINYINDNNKYTNLQVRKVPVINQNKFKSIKLFQEFELVSFYILVPSENLQEVFFNLTHTPNWNPRAKFLVVLDALDNELFTIAEKYYVFDILALVYVEEVVDIFSYHPFGTSEPVLLNRYANGTFSNLTDLFPSKLPTNWENVTIRTILYSYPPYVFTKEEGVTLGMEIDALKLLQSVIGFNVIYVKKSFANWGRKLENGSYEGAYSYLRNYEVDLGVGFFYANESEYWDFDETYPYMEDNIKWVVPMAKVKQRWLRVLSIFTFDVWLLIFLFFCCTSVLVFVTGTLSDESLGYKRARDCLTKCYQIFLGQAVQLPKNLILRFLIGLWVFFGLLITATFQGRLISVLNFNVREFQISNVDELLLSGIKLGIYGDTAAMFYEPNNKNDWYIYNHYQECPAGTFCLNRVAFRRDFATFKPQKLIEYMISTAYLDEEGNSLVYMFDENVFTFFITMVFVKGFPLYDKVNLMLSWLRSAGFIEYYYKTAAWYAKKAIESAKKSSLVFQVITVDGILWIFWFLLLGLIVASAVFIGEICVNKWIKKKNLNRWMP